MLTMVHGVAESTLESQTLVETLARLHPSEVKAFAAEIGHRRLLLGRPGRTVNSREALLSGRGGLTTEAVDDIVCHNLDRLLRRFRPA